MIEMTDLKLCLIPGKNVDYLWNSVTELIDKALQYSDSRFELNDIHKSLIENNMQLWTVINRDDEILAVLITQIIAYPRKKVLFIMFIAGVQFDDWINILPYLKLFALEHGCESIEGQGRRGWEKKISCLGFTSLHTVYTLPLKRN